MKKRNSPILSPGECTVLSMLLQQSRGSSATNLERMSGGELTRAVLYVQLARLRKRQFVATERQAQSVTYRVTPAGKQARKAFAAAIGLRA